MKSFPTADRLKEPFTYDPITGILRNRINRSSNSRAGDVLGTVVKTGKSKRLLVGVDGDRYYIHQVAWTMMTGEWPSIGLDHRDENGLNNKFSNLRLATKFQNACNTSRRKDNTSGCKGVSWDDRRSNWRAYIGVNGKVINLGRFKTFKEAEKAYKDAALRYHEDFARF